MIVAVCWRLGTIVAMGLEAASELGAPLEGLFVAGSVLGFAPCLLDDPIASATCVWDPALSHGFGVLLVRRQFAYGGLSAFRA